MARQINVTDTLAVHPTAYDEDDHSYASISSASSGYTDSSSTNYATVNLTTGSGAETYIYWEFDTSSIPANATITSVTCQAKIYINQTSSTYITTRQAQLFSGTTAKGTAYTVSNSTTAFTISAGSWTRAQISDLRLRLYAVRASRNTTTSYYFRFYGATVTINYSVSGTIYSVTATSEVDGVTPVPAQQEIFQQESGEVDIYVDELGGLSITDNGVDISSSLVRHEVQSGGTLERAAASYTTGGSISSGSSYLANPVGHTVANPSTYSSNVYSSSGSTGYAIYSFDFSEIPINASIASMQVQCRGLRENASTDSTHMAKIGLYSGDTLKSTEQQFTSTSVQTITISSPGTWTAEQLHNAKLRFTVAYYGGRLYGITWTVTYTMPSYGTNYYWSYSISSIAGDHVILVTTESSQKIYVKVNGNWVPAGKVYKKVSGSWVEQTDLTSVFSSGVNYIKGN